MTTRHRETPFSVLIDGDSDPAVIRVGGELDSNSARELRAGMTGVVGRQQTIVDIREVSFVDSAGLGALVGGIRRLREAGGSVVLCCTRASVLRLLRMTGLDRIVAVTGSLGEARRAVADALLPA
jgi:anti-sigma B factor antagonist